MRIERLDLIRYGSFSDRSLSFRDDARLHLVYGPNEAGKSTALAAITDLLFGFPHAIGWDFMHAARSLRLGASLANRNGERLAFRRKRGNKNTLLADDEDETPLRDDALAPFLGNLDREVFLSSFGLNSERLQEGARALLAEEGDGRGALFAAASGRHAIATLRKSLDTEADGIFAARSSKDRRFFQALARHDEATRLMRERELREAAWKALNADVEATAGALEEATATLRDHRARERRLQRLVSLSPRLRELVEAERALAEHDDLADVPEDLAAGLEAATLAFDAAREADRAARARLAEAEETLAAISVDETLLGREGEIAGLVAETGAYRQRLGQIPRVQAEVDDHDRDIAALLRRLGLPGAELGGAGLTAAEFARIFPGDAVLARLGEEVAEGRRLAEALAILRARGEDETRKLAEMTSRKAGAVAADPAPLAARFNALKPELASLDQAGELASRHKTLDRESAEAAARLDPPVADPEALAGLPLPSPAEIDAHRAVQAELAEAIRRREAACAERRASIRRRVGVIEETERAGDVPSAAAIREARAARDAVLAGLPDALATEPALRAAHLAGLSRLVEAADALADRALSEAERVSRLRAEREALAGEREELAELEGELKRLHWRREAALADWRALFAPLGIEPAGPERMADWRRALDTLLAARAEAAACADRLAVLHERAEALADPLSVLAGGLGLHQEPGERVRMLARRVEEALAVCQEAWTAQRVEAGLRADIESRLVRIAEDRADLETRQRDWRARFDRTLERVGLERGDTPGAAEAALAAWRELPGLVARRDHEARRVAGMRRDNTQFEDAAASLAAALAPGLAGLPPAQAVQGLSRLREDQLAAASRRESALTVREGARRHAGEAAAQLGLARDRLADLVARLPARLVPSGESGDPAPLLARLAERRERLAAHAQSLRRFTEVADGLSREAAEHELVEFDRDGALVDLDLLRQGEEALTAAQGEAYSAHQAALARRREAEAGEGAEQAAFARGAAEADMLEVGREWTVLRIAALMLDAALERHREAEGDPLLASAGEIFARVTGGAYVGLSRGIEENDETALVARRADGTEILVGMGSGPARPGGLSEGTLNQLYLALRLAFLSDYAGRAEPAPFIGDDLFQTFDDARTANGIAALADLSGRLQPILFTHHLSVVEIARAELGDGLDLIEL